MQKKQNAGMDEYVKAFQSGEERGFVFFFNQYYKTLCLFSYRLTKKTEIAEEIVGDAFIKLWERHEGFSHPLAIKSFLYTVCKNMSFTWLHKQRRDEINKEQHAIIRNIDEPGVLHHMIAAEVYTELYNAIDTLPTQCKKIFKMHLLQGKNYSEIAQELNLSVSTVWNQKARAIKLLKQRASLSLIIFLTLYYHPETYSKFDTPISQLQYINSEASSAILSL